MSTRERARKTGSAGRFGARYGRVARRRISEIESDMNESHRCPECGARAVSRAGTGIWECRRCGHKYTGGAYRPETPGGRSVRRSIRTALAGEEAEAEAAAAVAAAAEVQAQAEDEDEE